MNSAELAEQALNQIQTAEAEFNPPELHERFRRNAGRAMQEIVAQRLKEGGTPLEQQKGSRYRWGEGIILNRNSRVGVGFWSNMPRSQLDDLRQVMSERPAIFLFCFYQLDEARLHVWAIPDELAIRALSTVPDNKTGSRTVYIDPADQRLKYASDSPDLSPFYRLVELSDAECEALAAGIKQDAAAKELSAGESETDEAQDDLEQASERYSQETVDFLIELPDRTTDAEWHVRNKSRYERVLRDPTRALVELLRSEYINGLDSAVAAANYNVSKLKKNDYGKGGYHDHYWAAFFDPNATSKTKSCQLFFRLLGEQRQFRYGFAFGNYCDDYIANLTAAIDSNQPAVKEYLLTAPEGTIVRPGASDEAEGEDVRVFAAQIGHQDAAILPSDAINIVRRFPLEELPDHADTLVSEIGQFFEWVWPFFDAARTGVWKPQHESSNSSDELEDDLVDEGAPQTLQELSDLSALSIERLQEIEDALLTKQQIVLTGPPGTSKTYIAQLFARYFAADRETNSQGKHTTLFMHANWAYEDFFEGIKPFTDDGVLKFEPKLGCFLEWIESLAEYRPTGRHVLVLDEINRCDTAAVLGELLQLLEYRGRAVRLLSGRKFRFPSNVYIIGTMNSADRSIGRMDLALRRRFLWLDLVPDYDILHTWLSRTGNNPSRFTAQALRQCNRLLEERGIAPEQQVGHALFMVQTFGSETQESEDKPLIAQALKRIVRFSVLPYVKEVCVMQFGRVDQPLIQQIERVLLECLGDTATPTNSSDAEPESNE